MKKLKVVLLLALVGLVLFGAGCVGQADQSTIRSDAEAGERVTDIGEQVSDISNAVEDVDTALG